MKPVMKRPKHARVGNNPRTKTNLIPYSVVYALSHERLGDKKYELNFRVTSPSRTQSWSGLEFPRRANANAPPSALHTSYAHLSRAVV